MRTAVSAAASDPRINVKPHALQEQVDRGVIAPDWALWVKSDSAEPDMVLHGKSTLYNMDGEVVLQWVKERADEQWFKAAVEETVKALIEPVKGKAKPAPKPKVSQSETLCEYILADLHLGMYAWGEETGSDDYDLNIAVGNATQAIDRLLESTPPSAECVINQLGDFLHQDSNEPVTPRGRNIVDTDTRYRKVVRYGISLMRHVIDSALKKHETVRVRNTPGNHDPHSSVTLDEALRAFYDKEPRIVIEDSPRPFWAYRFGRNLIGIAHGHAPKPKQMPGLLAADYPQWWAETDFRFCRHGHLHHARTFEEMGVKCEGFRTLAPRDAWTTSEGYRSGREIVAIVLDREAGETERHTRSIESVRANNT